MATRAQPRLTGDARPALRVLAVARGPATAEQGARWAVGVAVVAALVLGALEGGYAPARWAPVGVALLWAAAGATLALRHRRPPRAVLVGLGAYAALTAWTAASVLWADTPGRALDAAGRTAVYGLALTLAVLPRWPAASLRRLLALVGAGTAVLAAATLLRVAGADDPSSAFVDGRLVAPTGYVNATPGLWLIGLFPLVHLAAGGARHPAARVAALVGAGLLLELGVLSQSRGAMLACAVAVVVLLALTPSRGAVLLVLAALGAVTALVGPTLLDVRGAPTVPVLAARLDDAAARIALGLAALAVAGGAWQLVLRSLPSGARRGLADPRLGRAATVAVAVALLVGLVATVGNPVSWAAGRARDALGSDGYARVAADGDRLTGSLGSNRGDMYRVALGELRAHPLTGSGAEDFQPAYLRERRSAEAPRYAHSLPLGVLAGLGLVGGALLLVALAAPAVGALRAARATRPATRAGVAAAVAAFAAWAAGSAWDWTWEFPALTVLPFALLGAAARATDEAGAAPAAALWAIQARARAHGVVVEGDRPGPFLPRSGRGRVTLVGALVVVLAATGVLSALGLASAFLRDGTARSATDPAGATVAFDRAARLHPLDADALLRRAIVARRLGDGWAWRRDLERARQRAPQDWFVRLQLGLAHAAAGDRRRALAELRRARALNPQQPAVGVALDALRRGGTVDPAALEGRIAGTLSDRMRPTRP